MKTYTLKIIDPTTKTPLLFITEKEGFQIEGSISYYDIGSQSSFNSFSIYNIDSKIDIDKFKGAQVFLELGFEPSGLTNLLKFEVSRIQKSLVLQGFIFDCVADLTAMPNLKYDFKVMPYLETNNNQSNDKEVIFFKKNTSLYDFVKTTLAKYSKIDILPFDSNIQGIQNKTQDLNFIFDPMKTNILESLNNFILEWSLTNYKTPLRIISTLNGFVLGYDYFNSKTKDFQDQIKASLLSLKTINLTPNYMIQAPISKNINELDIQTIILPQVKCGSILNISNPLIFKDLREIPYISKVTGLFYVNSLNIVFNFHDPNPLSWTALYHLIKL